MKKKKLLLMLMITVGIIIAGFGAGTLYHWRMIEKKAVVQEDKEASIDMTKVPFSVFINGMDHGQSLSQKGNSDLNVLVTVNPASSRILITTISRDAYVPLAEKKGVEPGGYEALWMTGEFGTRYTRSCLEKLYDTRIPFYVQVNFKGMKAVVDTLGGVDVYSDESFTCDWGYHYKKGINHVNGKQALGFCRERHAFTDGDDQRAKNHRYMLEAIFNKVCQPSSITKYPELMGLLGENIRTNVGTEQMKALAKWQLRSGTKWQVDWSSVQGKSSRKIGGICGKEIYVQSLKKKSLTKAQQKIKELSFP